MCDLAVVGRARRLAADPAAGLALADAHALAEWHAVTAEKKAGEPPIRAAARRSFARQEADVLAQVRRGARVEVAFDVGRWALDLAAEMGPGVLAGVRRGLASMRRRIDVPVGPFDPDDPRVRAVLTAVLGKTSLITDTTRDRLTRALVRGVSEGEDQAALARRVAGVFAEARGYRARAIAQTAATAATEAGGLVAMEDAGLERRAWGSQRAGNTRPAHAAADGQERALGEPFEVGGEALMYPGDPAGSAAMTANCFCYTIPLL